MCRVVTGLGIPSACGGADGLDWKVTNKEIGWILQMLTVDCYYYSARTRMETAIQLHNGILNKVLS